jgi:hypothetical protein
MATGGGCGFFLMDAAECLTEHEWCDGGFDIRDVCVLFEGFDELF